MARGHRRRLDGGRQIPRPQGRAIFIDKEERSLSPDTSRESVSLNLVAAGQRVRPHSSWPQTTRRDQIQRDNNGRAAIPGD